MSKDYKIIFTSKTKHCIDTDIVRKLCFKENVLGDLIILQLPYSYRNSTFKYNLLGKSEYEYWCHLIGPVSGSTLKPMGSLNTLICLYKKMWRYPVSCSSSTLPSPPSYF